MRGQKKFVEKKVRPLLAAILVGCGLATIAWAEPGQTEEDAAAVPPPEREFRGVWVSTVFNLDWPSKPGLPVETQQAELITILDRAREHNLNAIVLQVRTMCDALYHSPLEPWSYWLTGELGKAPEPFYDPLAFAVREAHLRGLELHAWINPFRAMTGMGGRPLPEGHITNQFPNLPQQAGTIQVLDPSDSFVRGRVLNVATDLVQRYDIDGLHLDDYFYPYPAKGTYQSEIDDSWNWELYQGRGGKLSKEDWRRENINTFIKELYHAVKRSKPSCKVGISPSGIWKRNHPETVVGLSSYHQIYVDSRKWLQEGWLDYFSPQLYWKIKSPQSFIQLHDWWMAQNTQGRHLWPGIFASRVVSGRSDPKNVDEVLQQIAHTRVDSGKSPGTGHIHWHWNAFDPEKADLSQSVTSGAGYVGAALTPASPWLAGQGAADHPDIVSPVEGIRITRPAISGKKWRLSWNLFSNKENLRWICVQSRRGSSWSTDQVLPIHTRHLSIDPEVAPEEIAIRVVDRIGTASTAARISLVAPMEIGNTLLANESSAADK